MKFPEQLSNDSFKFICIKYKKKEPFEKGWQNNTNYNFCDTYFIDWLKKGGNYGVVGGFGNLIILDFDNKEIEEKVVPQLPPTFTVRTGGGGKHLYYIADDPISFKVLDSKKNTLIDIQGRRKQVIGPGSTHPNGNKYEIINDRPISKINIDTIKLVLAPYLKTKHQYKSKWDDRSDVEDIKRKLSITTVMGWYGYDLSRNPTMCQLGHSSKGKSCFQYVETTDSFYCWHCDTGGDIFNLVMEHEGCEFPDALKKLAEMAGVQLTHNKSKKFKKPSGWNNEEVEVNNYYENTCNFFDTQPFFYDKNNIFWLWNKLLFKWEMVDDIDIMNRLDRVLGFTGETIGSITRNSYLEALKRVGRLRIPPEAPKTWIQFKDKIFNIETKELFKATPEYFTCNPIPHEIGESTYTPTIDKIFEEWVGENYIQTLFEIIAYSCLTNYPIHTIFCLIGGGRNGKSRFQALLYKFIGALNVCSTELDLLISNRFESAKLYKKLICLLGETNFGVMKKTSLIKKLSGGDIIGFEFKHKTPFDANNYAKIIISSNSLPTSDDTSEGFYRRWLIIEFPNEFPEGKDILDTIPPEEYNNLARKVIGIIPNLLEKGKFTNQGTIKQRQKKYIESSNPLPLFIEEFCIKDDDGFISYNELYQKYCVFLKKKKLRKVKRTEFKGSLEDEGFYPEKTSKNVGEDTFGDHKYKIIHWIDGLRFKK